MNSGRRRAGDGKGCLKNYFHFQNSTTMVTKLRQFKKLKFRESRHGICHGRRDIVRVKFYLSGMKQSFELTLFLVNSLLVSIYTLFCCLFGSNAAQMEHRYEGVCRKVYQGNVGVKEIFFLAEKVLICAIFWSKTFSRNMCPCQVCAKFHVCMACCSSNQRGHGMMQL